MNRAFLSLFILLVASALISAAPDNNKYAGKWVSAKTRYGLKFESAEAERKAFNTYAKNMEIIETQNAMGTLGFEVGENQFTHMEMSELREKLLVSRERVQAQLERFSAKVGATTKKAAATTTTKKTSTTTKKTSTTTKAAEYLNYTSLFPPIKNQGGCGSCWTFAAAGIIEAQYAMKYNKVISLSEENLLDCTYSSDYNGCDGGLTDDCLYYAKTKGVVYTSSYPYVGRSSSCPSLSTAARVKVTSYNRIPTLRDQVYLKNYLKTSGPLSIYIQATQEFVKYKSGIFRDLTCSKNTNDSDHAVILVGYGTENGTDYWLVRNSWGRSWGMNGYVKMIRNTNNDCLVSSYPIYVKL